MELGKRRPLCCFCWLFCVAVAVGLLLLCHAPTVRLIAAGALLLLCLALHLLARLLHRREPQWVGRAVLRYCAMLVLAMALGLGVLSLHLAAWDRTQVYAEEQHVIHGTIVTREYNGSFATGYCIDVEEIDRTPVRTRAYLDCPFVAPLQVGDEVTLSALVTDLRTETGMERYLAEGCRFYLAMHSEDDLQSVRSGTGLRRADRPLRSILMAASRLQQYLSGALRAGIDGEEGDLSAALLLGDRTHVDSLTTLQFRRAGASHLLALSGMHLGIIMAVVAFLLLHLHLPYRLRLLLLSLVAIAYLLLTGCALSTLRATVMLIYLQLAHHLGRRGDGLTSLSLFFAVCIAVQPYMLFDITLWLTSLAVAVPVAILPALQRSPEGDAPSSPRRRRLRSLVSTLLTPVAISLLCMVVLILPMWIAFGEMSLLSPIATLLLTLPVTALLCLGVVWLLLFPFVSLSSAAAFWSALLEDGMRWLANVLLESAASLSSVDGAVLCLRDEVLHTVLPLLGVVLVCLLLLRLRRRTMAAVLGVALLLSGGALGASLMAQRQQILGAYVARGNSELVVACSGEDVVVCDVSDGSFSAYSLLISEGLPAGHTRPDALVLTHYHGRHVSTLERLSAALLPETLWLPLSFGACDRQKAEQDEDVARKLLAIADRNGLEVRFYETGQSTALTEEITLLGMEYAMLSRSAHPVVAFSLRMADEATLSYVGAAFNEDDKLTRFVRDIVAGADGVILGAHGPVFHREFHIEAWSEQLHVLLIHGEGAGQCLAGDAHTIAAVARAEVHAVLPREEGTLVSFVLPKKETALPSEAE